MSVKEKGFSLPEITVALGLVAGISLVTVKVMDNQANNEARLKAHAEIQKTTALIKGILNNPENCRNMLKDQPLDKGMGGAAPLNDGVTDIALPPVLPSPAPAAANPTKPGLYQRIKNHTDNSYRYKEILAIDSNYGKFRIGAAGSIQLVKVTDTGTTNDSIELVIKFRTESKAIFFRDDDNDANDRTLDQRIPLLVTLKDPGAAVPDRITDCGLVVSDANLAAKEKLCLSLGSMARWTGTECEFEARKCGPGQVPAAHDSSNANVFTCVNIEDKFEVSQLFDWQYAGCSSPSGNYRIVSVNVAGFNKLRIQCF